jgi:Proteolipid membrane potential modulator
MFQFPISNYRNKFFSEFSIDQRKENMSICISHGDSFNFNFFLLIYPFFGMQVEFWVDLLLTILGYIPGIIYAIYVLV